MADAGVDIAELTEEQQQALQQFTAVTDQEIKDAVPLLQRCQWNVQIAIARFFDGEPADDLVAAAAAAAAPQDTRRQETLMNGFASPRSSTSSRPSRIEPAPRVVPQPENQVAIRPPLLLAIFFAPFSLVCSLFSRWFRFVGWMFPPLTRLFGGGGGNAAVAGRRGATGGRRPLNPRDTAARFIREFEEEYGEHRLPFFENGYAQAFDLAKKKLQFLLVILVSPEHDETASFIRETLLSQEVVDFIRNPDNNIILWAGNVQDPEAYQVSTSLNCTKFPFAGLIVHTPQVSSTAMGIATRITGPTPPTQFISKLRQAIQTHSEPLTRVRAQRAEQQTTRNIREQQNSAYERSLAIDRERARKKKEEAERKAREEKEALERQQATELHAEKLAQWRKWRSSSIAAEPPATEKEVVRISLRMPNADRMVRRFATDAHIEELYAFVECYDVLQTGESTDGVQEPENFEHEYEFQLVSPMPREVYDLKAGGTIRERIGRSGNLIVERTNVESDDEEEDE
ncbi:UBX domain-containing protein 10 [Didymosphaeria variabile]|uniref:UBX domain-containing protein 10 n=1 Tax=Didymosphaeria variabile TaxID=1932322 RepID=A0A9W8XYP0_9PLEO|nr:UBX domain-containing protein 10 [Didymosphaeria variabile]KAJ4360539.1 UBX domain-containing protein 10 [Didymosphaeria variabile]